MCPDVAAGDCSLKLCADALTLIERLESERDAALAKVPRWISVDERLPESGVHVFALCEIRANGGVIRRYVCDGFHVEAWKEKAGCYSEDCALVYNDEDDEYYLEEGWYEVIKNWEEYNSITIADFVTHSRSIRAARMRMRCAPSITRWKMMA